MSSRRRLYLNLKQSILKLFKTPAHYLKELTGKQSLFEKPYLDRDYRQMHLNLPVPSWKRPEFDPGGIWPPPRKHTFIFDDGICSLSGKSGDCGETIFLNGWIGLIPPGSLEREYQWIAQSSDDVGAQIQGIKLSLGGISASIQVKLGDDFTGTVTICAQASQVSGSFLKEIAFMVPSQIGGVPTVPGWIPSFPYALRNLPPLYEVREEARGWDCGCVDLEVVCECTGATWDSTTSAEAIVRESSCTVAITDGGSGTKTWSVSGTGFWFDEGYTITSLDTTANSVTLYADATACGTAVIAACGATGYVKCTTGSWSAETDICDLGYPQGAWAVSCQVWKKDEGKEYKLYMQCYDCDSLGVCPDTYNCTASYPEAGYKNCTIECSPPGGGTKYGLIQVTYRTWEC